MSSQIITEPVHPGTADRAALVRGHIEQVAQHGPGVTALRIRVAQGAEFAWLPGQYVNVLADDGRFRSFSLARPRLIDGCIELHVRRIPNGVFSDLAIRKLKCGDSVAWRGPFGDFGWRQNQEAAHAVFICTGTGFAPVRAIVESILSEARRHPISLYWGGRSDADLYLQGVVREWVRLHNNFRFIPVVSRSVGGAGDARLGRVQHAVMADFKSLADAAVYACGSPGMIADAREVLTAQRGLRPNAFFADPFGNIEVESSINSDDIVRICANGIDHRMSSGQSLLAGLRAEGVTITSVCGGRGACGTCLIEIDNASRATLAPPGGDERDLLECLPDVSSRARLACQIRLDKSADGLALSVPLSIVASTSSPDS